MDSDANLSRARQGCHRALAELDRLEHRLSASGDPSLRSTLIGIRHHKARQSRRLLEWLRTNGPGEEPAAQAAPFTVPDAVSGTTNTSDITASQTGGNPSLSSGNSQEATVIERREVTPELLVFRVSRPAGFSYGPGQSVKLAVEGTRRTYSLVSAPHEPFLEFFVELVPGGEMSERLRHLQVGGTVSLGQAKGGLTFNETYPRHLMIATVTGINPFVSMVRDLVHRQRQTPRILLMHGASYQQEFGYREELEAVAARHPTLLTYLPTVSRPDEPANRTWSGHTGRVDTLVEETLQREALVPEDTLVYACGHSGMLDAVSGCVQPRGFRLEIESYD